MTQLPAVVTIPDLDLATTVSSAALMEVTQTSPGGTMTSYRASVSQVVGAASISSFPLTSADDSNVTLTLGGSPASALLATTSLTLGWTGTLAASRLNSSVVQSAASDTNVTGAVASQVLTLGWTGTLSVPRGGIGTGSLTSNAVLLGAGTATLGLVAAGTTGWPLVANGTSLAPSYQLLNLTTGATGVLTVPFGGTGTSTLSANAVLLGAGTSTLAFAAPATAGNLLIDQGVATVPAFRTVTGDLTMGALGTATIATGAVSLAKIAAGTGLAVFAYNSTTLTVATTVGGGSANQVLAINAGATGIIWTTAGASVTPYPLTSADDTNVTLTLGGSPATALLATTSLTLGWTSVLSVVRGGSGTGTLTSNAVLLGGTTATATLQFAAVQTAGRLLIDQGVATVPLFQVVTGDLTMGALGTATIATGAVSLTKIASGTGLAVFAYNSTTLTVATTIATTSGNQFLSTNAGGTGLVWAASGGFTAATQAELEAATSTTVGSTPGRQQFHPSAAKVWGTVTYAAGADAPALQDTYNVTSVTDGGTTDTTFNFTTAFSNATYTPVVSGASGDNPVITTTGRSAGSILVTHATEVTATRIYLAAFGDQ